MRLATFLLAPLAGIGCSSSPAPDPPATPAPPVAARDAAIDAPPDADVPDEVATAPAWVFRYHAADRLETWTLRHSGGRALLVVETARGPTRYTGAITDALKLTVAAGTNRLALECKRNSIDVGAVCGDKKPAKLDVLDCFHPDFKSPMSFAPAPGISFVTTASCSGYVRIAP